MIKSLHCKNFKCFDDKKVAFSELTILAGANAAGKSSIIQALLLADYTGRVLSSKGVLQGVHINVNEALGISVGSPKALITQNPIELAGVDFSLSFDGESECCYEYGIDKQSPLYLQVLSVTGNERLDLSYLNAERLGPRTIYEAGSTERILMHGENAAFLMEVSDMEETRIPELLLLEEEVSSKFSFQVEQWMSEILGEMTIDVRTDYDKASTELTLKNSLTEWGVVPTLTGFGISYILPVVVSGLRCSARPGSIFLVENPEAHLHPRAQSNMGQFLALLALSGVQVIVETHSEHIIDGARYAMSRMEKSDAMLVDFFVCKGPFIDVIPITVNPAGELSQWPEGFFDQKQYDLRKLLMLRRENERKKQSDNRKL